MMLDQSRLEQLKTWTEADLPSILPKAEDADFEFKSSLIGDGKLQSVLQKAASGFWNSGGGYFVAGVDEKTGQPDGGISTTVGRTARRDWMDRAIAAVSPGHPNGYLIQEIVSVGSGLNISAGRAVYVVGFVGSEFAPHMADGCYYVRSGAHTDPAPAFIVEALFARRGMRQPQLRIQVRRHPLYEWILQLGIVNVSLVPAIDVEIEFETPPKSVRVDQETGRASERVNLIDRDTPFYLDYADRSGTRGGKTADALLTDENRVTLRYHDPFLRRYEETVLVSPKDAVAVSPLDGSVLDRISMTLTRIARTLSDIERKLG